MGEKVKFHVNSYDNIKHHIVPYDVTCDIFVREAIDFFLLFVIRWGPIVAASHSKKKQETRKKNPEKKSLLNRVVYCYVCEKKLCRHLNSHGILSSLVDYFILFYYFEFASRYSLFLNEGFYRSNLKYRN